MAFMLLLLRKLALAFGLIFGLLEAVFSSDGASFLPIIAVGIFFGLGMSLVLGRRHDRSVKRLIDNPTGLDFRLYQNRTVLLNEQYSEVLSKCVQALSEIGAEEISVDTETGRINARCSMTRWSWGGKITVQLSRSDSGVRIVVWSEPKLGRITAYDFGENLSNVLKFERIVLHGG